MDTTSLTLLERLKNAQPDSPDWGRLQDTYLPFLRAWLRRVPRVADEADDLAQEVLLIVVRELPTFERRRDGSFRAWLKKITYNRIRSYLRQRQKRPVTGDQEGERFLAQLEDPTSDLSQQWNTDHDQHVLPKLLALVKADFETTTWEAFTRFGLHGRRASEVAAELGITVSGVMQAKFRVLKRLREEVGDCLD